MGGKQKEHLTYPEQNHGRLESQKVAFLMNDRKEDDKHPEGNEDIDEHLCLPFKLMTLEKMDTCCKTSENEEVSCSHFQKVQVMRCLWEERCNECGRDSNNEEVVKDDVTNDRKLSFSLSVKGTKSLKKKKPPDSERSVQRTQSCKYKEKVQKLNRENTEKTTVIIVKDSSTEIEFEDNRAAQSVISIDISNSHPQTCAHHGSPIIFSVQEEDPIVISKEIIEVQSEIQEHEDQGEEALILKSEIASDVHTEDKHIDEDEGEVVTEEEDDETCNDITITVLETTDPATSEDLEQTLTGTNTSQDLTTCPVHDTEVETIILSESKEDEEDNLCIDEEDKEEHLDNEEERTIDETVEDSDDHGEKSCTSKRRVTTEDEAKEENKKSKLDTDDVTSQDAEVITNDLIKNAQTQESESAEENLKQTSIKEEDRTLVLDIPPAPPAPFDHRIVSAKHALINNFYNVEQTHLLGGGRFGQVHRCTEKSSGLTLAAKIIKAKGHKEKEEVKNEIQVMNQLNHVNLVQLYDAFESRNDIVLVMEYMDGGELFDKIIDENCTLSEVDTIKFIKQICEGIQYMHQMYIIHLDLKPENIMCVNRADYQIKIIDFGLARRYKPREKLKVHFGTPEFLAPEVVNYDFVSFPTDMWSVGVIAYMLLSGLSPFLGEDYNETLNNILTSEFDFECEEFQNISEVAKDFISKLLIKEKCWRMSAGESLKHQWLSDSKFHYTISQNATLLRNKKRCSLSEAPAEQ